VYSQVKEVTEVRARWLGHRLHAEVNISVDPQLTITQAHAIAAEVRHRLLHHLSYLSLVVIHVDPADQSGEDHHRISEQPMTGCPCIRTPERLRRQLTHRSLLGRWMMAKQKVLGFKPAARLEQIDEEHSEQVQDCEHRPQSCDDSASPVARDRCASPRLREIGLLKFLANTYKRRCQ
jgi:hypothetical protein